MAVPCPTMRGTDIKTRYKTCCPERLVLQNDEFFLFLHTIAKGEISVCLVIQDIMKNDFEIEVINTAKRFGGPPSVTIPGFWIVAKTTFHSSVPMTSSTT